MFWDADSILCTIWNQDLSHFRQAIDISQDRTSIHVLTGNHASYWDTEAVRQIEWSSCIPIFVTLDIRELSILKPWAIFWESITDNRFSDEDSILNIYCFKMVWRSCFYVTGKDVKVITSHLVLKFPVEIPTLLFCPDLGGCIVRIHLFHSNYVFEKLQCGSCWFCEEFLYDMF